MGRRLSSFTRAVAALLRPCSSGQSMLEDLHTGPSQTRSQSIDRADFVPLGPLGISAPRQQLRAKSRKTPRTQSRSQRASSVAHRFPWEVLLAICEQADATTLVQLCLVSFSMLSLAGPALYRHVAFVTLKPLCLFLFKPSVIQSKSRLRPLLGYDLVQRFSVDYRGFRANDLEPLFGLIKEGQQDRGRAYSCLYFRHIDIDLPVNLSRSTSEFRKAVANCTRPSVRSVSTTHYSTVRGRSGTLDVELADVSFLPTSRLKTGGREATRLLGIKLTSAGPILARELDRQTKDVARLRVSINLARIVPLRSKATSKSSISRLRTLVSICLSNEHLWRKPTRVEVLFWVASPEIGKAVEELIAASTRDERKKRCRVILQHHPNPHPPHSAAQAAR